MRERKGVVRVAVVGGTRVRCAAAGQQAARSAEQLHSAKKATLPSHLGSLHFTSLPPTPLSCLPPHLHVAAREPGGAGALAPTARQAGEAEVVGHPGQGQAHFSCDTLIRGKLIRLRLQWMVAVLWGRTQRGEEGRERRPTAAMHPLEGSSSGSDSGWRAVR